MQVPRLKISGLDVPETDDPELPEEEEEQKQACIQHPGAAELLAAVPTLIIGEPGSHHVEGRSSRLEGWPAYDDDLTVALWHSLEPLAPHLAFLHLKA